MTMMYIIIVDRFVLTDTVKSRMTPDLDFPIVLVMTNYSGAGPEDIENLVTRTVESGVSSTENVKKSHHNHLMACQW